MVDVIDKIKKVAKESEEEIEEALDKVEETIGMKPKKTSKKSLAQKAEEESTTGEKSIEEKKKALLEKVLKLKEKVAIGKVSSEELKEQVKAKKKSDMLVPLEEYVKSGIYLGTRVVTPDMKPFVYRRRADGLAIFNTDTIDEKIKEGIAYLSEFAPEDVVLVCKRQAGWKVAIKFSEITGIKVFTKKYPAGVLTNKLLPDFFENELTIVTDQWVDRNALNDTLRVKKKVLMICDTNNFAKGANKIIIGNNKHDRSLGLIFYLLARGYCQARGIKANVPDLDWWVGEEEERKERPRRFEKSSSAEAGAQFGV
ncbi:MAG: hypothetical protein AABX91_02430 [Nanoarchaeota archaeon]